MSADMEQRKLAAIHEAGHACAAVMRGGSTLTSVSLSSRHGEGITWRNGKPFDDGFVAYAGPWAEARHLWTVGDESADGFEFVDVMVGVLLEQESDFEAYRRDEAERVEMFKRAGIDDVPSREPAWDMELSRVWPAMQSVAALLLAGVTVSDAVLRALVEAEDFTGSRP